MPQFVQTQTSELPENHKDELEILSQAMWLVGQKRYDDAVKLMIDRHDKLMKEQPLKMKLYGT